jgi:hypothetical protein
MKQSSVSVILNLRPFRSEAEIGSTLGVIQDLPILFQGPYPYFLAKSNKIIHQYFCNQKYSKVSGEEKLVRFDHHPSLFI